MDAVAAANHQFELQRQAFIYADIKTELLDSFRNKSEAYVYHENDEGSYYSQIDTKSAEIFDDKQSSSFKVGDNFSCLVRQSRKELWFQIKNHKTLINLRDPNKYFKREINGVDYYIFVALTELYIVMLLPQPEDFQIAKALLSRMSKSIINYDKHGQAVVKPGVK
jgi:hypothetical protein